MSWRSVFRFITVLSVLMLAVVPSLARAEGPATPSVTPVVARALTGLNVRSGPGIDFTRIGYLVTGQQVALDGRSGDWYRFSYPHSQVKGWIMRSLVKVTGDPNQLPDVTFATDVPILVNPPLNIPGVPESQPTGVVTATALANVIIRGGPGTKYQVLGVLEKDQTIVIDGRSLDWYRFSYPNSFVKGWLFSGFVKITGDVTKLMNVTFPPQGVSATGH